jgi:hypothetical protein
MLITKRQMLVDVCFKSQITQLSIGSFFNERLDIGDLHVRDGSFQALIAALPEKQRSDSPWENRRHCGRSLLGQTYGCYCGAPITSNSFLQIYKVCSSNAMMRSMRLRVCLLKMNKWMIFMLKPNRLTVMSGMQFSFRDSR